MTRRTDDPAGPHRRTELFTAYRQVLIDIGADGRGSDQNSLLLRLLDGEEKLARLGEELARVRAQENQLHIDLANLEEQIRRAGASTAGTGDRKRQLEEEERLLAVRRSGLVERRSSLIGELDACRTQLSALEAGTGSDLVPVSTGGGGGQGRTTVLPPAPPAPPESPKLSPGAGGQTRTQRPGRWRAVALMGGAVAVVLLAGGGAAVGIWATGPHDNTGKTAPTPASTAPVPGPTTAEPATLTPSTAPPSAAGPSATNTSAAPPAPDPPAAGTQSLVRDLAAFEDDGYLSGPQTVNLREYPDALRAPDSAADSFLYCDTIATWQLDRAYTTLVTDLGITDDSPTSSSADFTVTIDGKAGFQRTMKVGQTAEADQHRVAASGQRCARSTSRTTTRTTTRTRSRASEDMTVFSFKGRKCAPGERGDNSPHRPPVIQRCAKIQSEPLSRTDDGASGRLARTGQPGRSRAVAAHCDAAGLAAQPLPHERGGVDYLPEGRESSGDHPPPAGHRTRTRRRRPGDAAWRARTARRTRRGTPGRCRRHGPARSPTRRTTPAQHRPHPHRVTGTGDTRPDRPARRTVQAGAGRTGG